MLRALAVMLTLAASAAWGCPVCGAPKDESVYLAMTIFMSLTPLIAMGTVVGVIVVRSRRQDRTPPQ